MKPAGSADGAQFLTVREAARRLRVAPVTVYRMVAGGRLRAARVGAGGRSIRVPESALQELVAIDETEDGGG